jgi:hypothetical protein
MSHYSSTVVVGEWDMAKSPDCNSYFCAPPTQAIKVETVIVHPGYEQKIFRHDIALIVLKDEISFSGKELVLAQFNNSYSWKTSLFLSDIDGATACVRRESC